MAIIRLSSRPAIPIVGGTFEAASGEWECLNNYRQCIENTVRGIGRVELEGHPYLKWVGTGVFVAPGRFITAAHVAKVFSNGVGDRDVGINPEFKVFLCSNNSLGLATDFRTRVASVNFIHPVLEVALCELDVLTSSNADSEELQPLFSGLTLAARVPQGLIGRKVAVVGFGSQDSRNDPTILKSVFGDVRESLYLQPGELVDTQERDGKVELYHDCTTLGGSAGAPVLDLETGLILGIHFAGQYMAKNSAVPAWELGRDLRARMHGINFSDQPGWMSKWVEADIVSRLSSRNVENRETMQPREEREVRYFNQSDLYKIKDVLVRADFARDDRQQLLFISMNRRLVATLPTQGSPDSRLMSVLDRLNRTGPIADDEVPLRTLLFNATENSKPFEESTILETFLNRLPQALKFGKSSIKE